jgi:uncharacterized protein (TIGR01777 family)
MTATTFLISGASGFIGTELTRQLTAEGHTVLKLVRRPAQSSDERPWDPASGLAPDAAIEQADAVINLSGASLSRLPWTHPYKAKILRSRVQATTALARAIERSHNPPSVFVSGSAVGFYGDRPGEILTEMSARGSGFLSRVVESWEEATAPARGVTRVVHSRTGLVIGRSGALTPLMVLTQLGLSGPLGTGEQAWPWISLHDEAAAIRHLAINSELRGPVNLVGPVRATAGEVGRQLAERMSRPYWLPAPRWAIIAGLADAGRELLLADQAVTSKLATDGFDFRDETVERAIDSAVGRP